MVSDNLEKTLFEENGYFRKIWVPRTPGKQKHEDREKRDIGEIRGYPEIQKKIFSKKTVYLKDSGVSRIPGKNIKPMKNKNI